METNNTIYINNLNEKIKKEGKRFEGSSLNLV